MAKYTSNQATQDETENLDEDFFFDEDEDALMDRYRIVVDALETILEEAR